MQTTQTTTPSHDQATALHKLAVDTFTATNMLTRARGGWVPPDVLAACADRLLAVTRAGALRTLEDQVYVLDRVRVAMETFNAESLESLAAQSRAAEPGLVFRAAALMLHLHQHPDDPAGWPLQAETAWPAMGLADWYLYRLRPTLPPPEPPEVLAAKANAAANAAANTQPAPADPVVATLPPPQNEPAHEAVATVADELPPTNAGAGTNADATPPPDAENGGDRSNQAERLEALLSALTRYAADHPDDPTPSLRTLSRSHGFTQEELGALAAAYPERLQLDAKPTSARGGRPSPTLRAHDAPATLP